MQLDSTFFTNNRNKLIAALPKKGIVVVAGNGRLQRTADSSFDFKQESSFYYLTGIEEPCATLVIDTANGTSWVMLPMRTGVHALFDGQIDIAGLLAVSGVDEIIDESEGWKRLWKLTNTTVFMPQKPSARINDMYTNPHRAAVARRVQRNSKKLHDIRDMLATLRAIKEPQEISIIDSAARITIDAIETVEKKLSSFDSEQSVEMALLAYFKTHGATGHAFSPIVASGVASCTFHYDANNQSLSGGVLLLDVGAEVANYSADISRTIISATNPLYYKVHTAVLEAQQALIRYARPGLTWQEFAKQADNEVGKQLVKLGYLQKGFSREQVRHYFPHAIGHYLGLDTHDLGLYTEPFAENMVITVEPGIYLPNEGFGVRIEDDIQITKKGAKVLGISS